MIAGFLVMRKIFSFQIEVDRKVPNIEVNVTKNHSDKNGLYGHNAELRNK